MRENSGKIEYINQAKGLGIAFIIFAHCIQYFSPMTDINRLVCYFHVPVFFIISGMLRKYKSDEDISVSKQVGKRIYTLIIPFIIFSLFNSILKFAVLFVSNRLTTDEIKDELIQLFITGNGTVWFLQALFIAEIIFLILEKYTRKIMIMYVPILFGIAYTFQAINESPIGVVIIRTTVAVSYMIVGYIVFKFIEKSKNIIAQFIILGTCLAIVICETIFNQSLYIIANANIGVWYISLPASIAGSIMVIFICKIIENKENVVSKWLSHCGNNSLGLMLIHPTVLLVFTYPLNSRVFEKVEGITGVCISIVLYIIVFSISLVIVNIVNSKFPFLFGKRKGK